MIIEVKVKTGSKKQEVEKISEREYKINLRERTENNKANIELLKLLRKYFGREVEIIKGLKNKNKIVEVK